MGDEIVVNLQVIIQASNVLHTQSESIDDAIRKADQEVGNLREMKSERLQQDIEIWDNLKSSLKEAVENLITDLEELRKLASDFQAVDKKSY